MPFSAAVQHKSGTGTGVVPSVALAGAPTQGNLLVAGVYQAQGTTAITITGWTPLTQAQGNSLTSRMFWKIAGAGESATVTAGTSTAAWAMAVAEYTPPANSTVLAPTQNSQEAANTLAAAPSPAVTPATDFPALAVCWLGVNANAVWSLEQVDDDTSSTNLGANVLENPKRTSASAVLFDWALTTTGHAYHGVSSIGSGTFFAGAIAIFRAQGPTHADSPSGSGTLSGSNVEAKTGSDSATGSVTGSGSSTESRIGSDGPSGTGIGSGALAASLIAADAPTGSATATGTLTERRTGSSTPTGTGVTSSTLTATHVFADTPSGTATSAGECTDAFSASIAPSGQVLASGSLAESLTSACAPSGAVTATGRCSDAVTFTVAPSGASLLSGSLVERKTGMDSPTGTAVASGTLATATSPGQVTLTVRAVFNVTLTEV